MMRQISLSWWAALVALVLVGSTVAPAFAHAEANIHGIAAGHDVALHSNESGHHDHSLGPSGHENHENHSHEFGAANGSHILSCAPHHSRGLRSSARPAERPRELGTGGHAGSGGVHRARARSAVVEPR